MSVAVVSCWRDHQELMTEYEKAVQGAADVVVVDTGSTDENYLKLCHMALRLDGMVASWAENKPFSFADACNWGLTYAKGDVVLMLNNDIRAEPGWLAAVERDTVPGALVGPATGIRVVAGQPILYVEGWCVAARRETWDALGGFDAETFQRPYWEDVDLSWRAAQMGIRLLRRPWAVTHIGGGNTTSRTTPGAYDASETNRQAFERKVRAAMVTA